MPAEPSDPDDLRRAHARIERLADGWPGRACVRKGASESAVEFDPDRPDFLTDLLPFHAHPAYQRAPEEMKRAALSCGWIAYNEKTVAIESKIVSPACMHLIDADLPAFPRDRHRAAVAQALTDEAFHVLLVVRATGVTRQQRRLQHLTLPQFELVTRMQRDQDGCGEQWKRTLIQLATAVVSEVLVSEYLSRLSHAADIQPLHRITTEIHRRDELAHSGLFQSLGAVIYHGLSGPEREFFVEALARPAAWFASPELDVWEAMLGQIGFPGAAGMIADCREEPTAGTRLDVTALDTLLAGLGVENALWARARPGESG
jgi:hypothetical protein